MPTTTNKVVTYGLGFGGSLQVTMASTDAAAVLTEYQSQLASGGVDMVTINRGSTWPPLYTPWSNVAWITVQ